jgi:3-hydroxy-9,10-secoandrosta-1,3,5(10)-triene-9,17-dione monooxygenase
VNDAPLYRVPFGQVFVRSVSSSAVGIARGALEFYLSVTASKIGAADGKKVSLDPSTQEACARAASTLDQIELVLHRNFDVMMGYAERGERIPIDERVAWRWDSSETVERCVALVDELFTLAGGRATFESSPMSRYFVDVHSARAHFANRPEASSRNYGGIQLGMRTRDFFI